MKILFKSQGQLIRYARLRCPPIGLAFSIRVYEYATAEAARSEGLSDGGVAEGSAGGRPCTLGRE